MTSSTSVHNPLSKRRTLFRDEILHSAERALRPAHHNAALFAFYFIVHIVLYTNYVLTHLFYTVFTIVLLVPLTYYVALTIDVHICKFQQC